MSVPLNEYVEQWRQLPTAEKISRRQASVDDAPEDSYYPDG